MNKDKLPSIFLAGGQKCATTWLYYCLKEHPETFVPDQNIINFFNINYYRGLNWYSYWYKDVKKEKAIIDTTMTYMRDPKVPQRIYNFNPNSKFIFSLRNPIDRAFSHYWHEKKKDKIDFDFDEALFYSNVGNYDLYENWIKPGFYYDHINRFLEYFNMEQMHFILFDEIKNNPHKVLKDLYAFINVDNSFNPSLVNQKINVAGNKKKKNTLFKFLKTLIPKPIVIKIKSVLNQNKNNLKSEYKTGINKNTKEALKKIYREELIKLEKLIKMNLEIWK